MDEAQTRYKRKSRIERRFQLIQLLGDPNWLYFRLLEEAATVYQGREVILDRVLAEKFSITVACVRDVLVNLEAAGLVILRRDAGGETQAYRLPSEGLERQFIDLLFA